MANGKYLRQRQKQGNPVAVYLHQAFIGQKLNNWVGILLIALISGGLAFAMSQELLLGIGVLGAIVGFFVIVGCMVSGELALYINVVYGLSAYHFSRWLMNDEFPVGVAWDIIILASLLGLFIRNPDLKKNTASFFSRSPVIWFAIVILFLLIQVANPEGTSVEGWFSVIRKVVAAFVVMFIAYNVFSDLRKIWRFVYVLFACAALTALYGCFQQFFGLMEFEEWWVRSEKARFQLIYVHGYFRKFSIMSDPTCFGIVIGGCALVFLVLGLEEKKLWKKAVLLLGTLVMVLGMSYSGTRTAMFMFVGGIALYILLTIHRKSTKLFAVFAVLGFFFLMYVPIYDNPTLIRFRTTFSGTKDESYKVREVNREFIRPYLFSHPIGGGLGVTSTNGTKYNPGHPLAGFPPDSGYLNKALETGWIGLAFSCMFFFVSLKSAVRGYFRARNHKIKTMMAAVAAFLFAFILGEIAQEAVGQFSNMIIYYPLIAVMLRLREISEKKTVAEQNAVLQEEEVAAY